MASAAEAGGKYLAFLERVESLSRTTTGTPAGRQLCLLRERKHIRTVYNAALAVSVVETFY